MAFDEIDPNDKNAVAKRMLQTMLKRQNKGEAEKAVQPDYTKKDQTKYTDVTPASYIGPSIPAQYQKDTPEKELVRVQKVKTKIYRFF